MIKEQQLRNQQYKTVLQRQELEAQQRAVALQRANRLAQYRYQQRYMDRLRAQRLALANNYDYYDDPYYYTAPSYQYSRAGQYYKTNQYGADLLRRAVNSGYEEGVRAGQADREDGYRADYRNSYAYQDANYGYTGMYVGQNRLQLLLPRGLPPRVRGWLQQQVPIRNELQRHSGNPEHRPLDHPQPAATAISQRGASRAGPPHFCGRAVDRPSTFRRSAWISARSVSISRACTWTAATVMLV